MKQVNTVESSKGGGMRRLARIVMGVLLDMDAKANEVAKAPLTPCSWVSEGSQCVASSSSTSFGKVVDSCEQLQQVRTLIHTTQVL